MFQRSKCSICFEHPNMFKYVQAFKFENVKMVGPGRVAGPVNFFKNLKVQFAFIYMCFMSIYVLVYFVLFYDLFLYVLCFAFICYFVCFFNCCMCLCLCVWFCFICVFLLLVVFCFAFFVCCCFVNICSATWPAPARCLFFGPPARAVNIKY